MPTVRSESTEIVEFVQHLIDRYGRLPKGEESAYGNQ